VEAKGDYVAEMEKHLGWTYETDENSVFISILEINSWCPEGEVFACYFLPCNR